MSYIKRFHCIGLVLTIIIVRAEQELASLQSEANELSAYESTVAKHSVLVPQSSGDKYGTRGKQSSGDKFKLVEEMDS